MINYTKEEIVRGILKNDHLVLQYIYKKYFNRISYYIKKNRGIDDDVYDIFQEAIIIIYRRLKANELVLTEDCSFETYLFAVCRLLWLKQLDTKKRRKMEYYEKEDDIDQIDTTDLIGEIEKNERYRLYQKHFMKLNEDCRKVLQLYLKKVSLKEIAEKMGYKSEIYAKKRKYQCKEHLVNSIKQDLEYKKYFENDT